MTFFLRESAQHSKQPDLRTMSTYANGVDNNAKQGKCLTYVLMQSILIITKMLISPT